jgi:serine/threonine protein kinase
LENKLFIVRDITTQGEYVLKQTELNNREMQRYEENIECWRRVESKFVVKYVDHYFDDNYVYIIMEYCSNGDVHKMIDTMIRNGNRFSEEVYIW